MTQTETFASLSNGIFQLTTNKIFHILRGELVSIRF